MIGKTAFVILLAALFCAAAPVVEQVSRGYHGSGKTYGKGLYYTIRNDTNSYMVYLQWVNATPGEAPKVLVGLPEPWFFSGFLSRGYSSLTVNGINSNYLEPKKIEMFNRDGMAGIELLYNFNGCRLFQRFYMVDGKPLLHMSWLKDATCSEPVETAEISFSARPSMVISNYVYQRAAMTKTRQIDTPPKKGTTWTPLKKEDSYWILYDKGLEPSTRQGAEGPCYITADWNGIKSAKMWYGNTYGVLMRFTLDPAADKWSFGTAEFKKASDNEPFFQRVRENESQFSL